MAISPLYHESVTRCHNLLMTSTLCREVWFGASIDSSDSHEAMPCCQIMFSLVADGRSRW